MLLLKNYKNSLFKLKLIYDGLMKNKNVLITGKLKFIDSPITTTIINKNNVD